MPEENIQLTPPLPDPEPPKTPAEIKPLEEHRKAEHIANEGAGRARETERRYDQDHGLISK
jgi:hypothetical protein